MNPVFFYVLGMTSLLMMQMIDLIKWCYIDLYSMDHQVLFISSTASCSKICLFNPCLDWFFVSCREQLQASENRYLAQKHITQALQAELLELYSQIELKILNTKSPAKPTSEPNSPPNQRYVPYCHAHVSFSQTDLQIQIVCSVMHSRLYRAKCKIER